MKISRFAIVIISAAAFFLSSCYKKESTELDLTHGFANTYLGLLTADSVAGQPGATYIINYKIKVTKLDATHVHVAAAQGTKAIPFDAKVEHISGPGKSLSIPPFTSGGKTYAGSGALTVVGGVVGINYAIQSDSSDVETYSGVL